MFIPYIYVLGIECLIYIYISVQTSLPVIYIITFAQGVTCNTTWQESPDFLLFDSYITLIHIHHL